MQPIQLNVRGIKCDAPACDYVDMGVTPDQYASYINKPCPECGANLLTKKDYRLMRVIQSAVTWINALIGPVPEESKTKKNFVRMKVHMNGSGIPQFAEVSEGGEEQK